MHEITVSVVTYPDRKNLVLRYVDPITGKQITKSAKTDSMAAALKAAGQWQDELRSGRYAAPSRVTWEAFRQRYEDEVSTGHAPATEQRASVVFNLVERIISPKLLRDVTAERVSYFQAELRRQGRSENTIASHCAHLKAALRWAERIGLLPKAPRIDRPRRAKGGKVMKGRPITTEEFERMLAKVPVVVGDAQAASWRHLLRGLWLSGLRLSEALALTWDGHSGLQVELDGKYPMLRIPAECEKGHKDRLLPMTPDFAEFLAETPEAERRGFVFRPLGKRGARMGLRHSVGLRISTIGEKAGVKVDVDHRTGKVKYASAHDLRRAFGERWAVRLMPHVLKEIMRHESIETTMRFYVGKNAETTAQALWQAQGNIRGNSDQKAGIGQSS